MQMALLAFVPSYRAIRFAVIEGMRDLAVRASANRPPFKVRIGRPLRPVRGLGADDVKGLVKPSPAP